MGNKWGLIAGIIFLITGILMKIFTEPTPLPIIIIVTGALFKIYYIIHKIKSGEYKPGFEMILLYIGIIIFFAGIYLRSHIRLFNPVFLMAPGIALKTTFIVLFIRKTK